MPETATKLPPLEVAENAGGGICIYEVGEEDYPIARMNATREVPVAQVRAEAEAIVRACNAREALVAACRDALGLLDVTVYGGTPAYESIKAALTLATEGV